MFTQSNNPILLTDPNFSLRLYGISYQITNSTSHFKQRLLLHENQSFPFSVLYSNYNVCWEMNHSNIHCGSFENYWTIWISNQMAKYKFQGAPSSDTSNIIKENNLFEKHVNLDNLILLGFLFCGLQCLQQHFMDNHFLNLLLLFAIWNKLYFSQFQI